MIQGTMKMLILCTLLLFSCTHLRSEFLNDRIRGRDEPQLVSYRVLEGVTEPFESSRPDQLPAWKLMKLSADEKSSKKMIQQALIEYGKILKNAQTFGEMPMDERYDVFLSMAKLLKVMGFHQKAELLLYEAISYTKEPYDAHLQLGLIALDKEDLDKAKMHMKNCLYYRETDMLILVHMTVILIAEGKTHEAKFYVTRVLAMLEARVQKFSFLYSNKEDKVSETLLQGEKRDYSALTAWLEELLVDVFHGEFRILPTAVIDSLRMFSHLYSWLNEGEMTGRYIFDLGQSLYEGGRPGIGAIMMHRGAATTDPETEGSVSAEIVQMRVALDYPVIPDTLTEIIGAYLNMTLFLQDKRSAHVDIDNSLDIYWPLPLLYFSALPLVHVMQQVSLRFIGGPVRMSPSARLWLEHSNTNSSAQLTASTDTRIEIGIFGGHINSHPIGQVVLYRLLPNLDPKLFRITLIATPLRPDIITKQIAALVHQIVNLPLDTHAAWKLIDSLNIDVLLFPDWQPFPDQQSFLFQSCRIAPVQICFFVRGSSCATTSVDYYLLPEDVGHYYKDAAFVDVNMLYSEQVVSLSWSIFTHHAIRSIAALAAAEGDEHSVDNTRGLTKAYDASELEGKIFFDGQPVAVFAAHPTFFHPLMDDVLFRIIHSCPSLQIVIVMSSSFFSHMTDLPRHRMNWARKLVRRLWARGGTNIHQRIRLLPLPVNDKRMLQLLRLADVVLDPFPIGSALHANALALSVGTPVVTMANGRNLQTPTSDLSELRMQLHNTGRKFESTWLYLTMMTSNASRVGNIPWSPSLSPLAGYYHRIGMAHELVANDTNGYFNIANKIIKDREYAYHIRVKLLEAIDGKAAAALHNSVSRNLEKDKDDVDEDEDEKVYDLVGPSKKLSFDNSNQKTYSDVATFLEKAGRAWAVARLTHS